MNGSERNPEILKLPWSGLFPPPFSSPNFLDCLSDLNGFTAENSDELHNLLDSHWRSSYENAFCCQGIFFFFLKGSILSMFLWWHQSQLSSELKTCALQAEEQTVVCDQFHLVVSFTLKNFTVSIEDGTKGEMWWTATKNGDCTSCFLFLSISFFSFFPSSPSPPSPILSQVLWCQRLEGFCFQQAACGSGVTDSWLLLQGIVHSEQGGSDLSDHTAERRRACYCYNSYSSLCVQCI